MDDNKQQDPQNAIIKQTQILRKVTGTIKKFPFVYTFILLCLSPFDAWLSLKWAQLLWLFTFTSLPTSWLCWKLSFPLKLCKWYRLQCVIILVPQIIPIFRIFCRELNILWVWAGVALIFVASLVNCYKTIIQPTVEENDRLMQENNIKQQNNN